LVVAVALGLALVPFAALRPGYASVADMDSGFSGDGTVVVSAFTDSNGADRVVVSPSGRVTLSGRVGTDVAFARFLGDGSPDLSFSGDGVATLSFPENEFLYGFAVQPDDKVLAVVGTSGYKIVRLLADGSLDPSFGVNGVAPVSQGPIPSGSFVMSQRQFEVGPDGGIFYVATAWNGGYSQDYLVKLTPSGTPDIAFDGDGFWNSTHRILDFEHFPDGKVLVLRRWGDGTYQTGPGPELLVRLTPTGSFDAGFAQSFVDVDSEPVLVMRRGESPPGFAVEGFNPEVGDYRVFFYTYSGGVDPARAPFTIPNGRAGLVPGPNGVMFGTRWDASFSEVKFGRLTASGVWSDAFAGDGTATITFGSNVASALDWAADGQGRLVVRWVDDNAPSWDPPRISRFKYTSPTPIVEPLELMLGRGRTGEEAVGDPVDTASGNLTDTFVDLSMGVFGLDVVRAYNGRDSEMSAVGPRWRVSVGSNVAADGAAMVVTLTDGTRARFEADGVGGWLTPDGFTSSLVADPAPPVGGGSLPMLRLAHRDGSVERFDTTGRLIEAIAWDGQVATSTYGPTGALASVTSSTGASLTFTYVAEGFPAVGLLESVTTSDGRSVGYSYENGTPMRLSQVSDEHFATTTFYYTAQGWLESIEDPSGRITLSNTYDSLGRVVSQTNASGGTTTFAYSDLDGVTVVTDSVTNTSLQYHHDANGKVLFISDPYGKTVERIYDANANLVTVRDRLGTTASATYDARGNVLTVTEPGRGTITYTYDTQDRVLTVTDPWNNTTTYSYQGNERLPTTVTNPLNQVTTYDVVAGLVMSVTDADGVTTTYTYDSLRRLKTVTDEAGNVTTTNYTPEGRVASRVSPSARTTAYTYDAFGRTETVTAPDGGVTTYSYDSAGRVLTTTDPTGAVTTNTYNPAGLLESVTNADNEVTTYAYDGNGQLLTTTEPGASQQNTVYAPLGRVSSTRDALERTSTYTYNDEGDLTSVSDPATGTTQTVYDTQGRPWKTIDPANRETVTTYDPQGRVQTVTEPGNRITTWEYDNLGRVTKATDPRGGQTTTTYTPGGRVNTITDPVGLVTTYGYDLAGRLATITEPGNRVTTYTYNADSEIHTLTSPGALVTTYTYDRAGRIATITDPAGVVTTRTWSTPGELLTEKVGAQGTITYTYDPDGTLATVTDALGRTTSYDYDARNNLTSRTNALGGVDTWSYNTANELVSRRDPLNRETTYTYDPAGRVATITDPTGRQLTNTYNLDGTLASRALLGGPTTSYTYDTAGRRATTTDPTGTYTYSYEPGDLLTSVTDPTGRATRWTYDLAGRRTSITHPDGASYGYTYDPAGRPWKITPLDVMGDSFTAANNAAPDKTKWTRTVASSGTATVQGNELELKWANTTGSTATVNSNVAAGQDHEITYRYRFNATSGTTVGKLITYLRYSTNGNIRVEQTSNSTTARIYKQIGTTSTQLGTFTVPVTTSARRIRVQLQGTTIRVRVWADNTTEPTTWTIPPITNATGVTTAGSARLSVTRTSGTNYARVDNWQQLDPTNPPPPIATYTYNPDNQITNETLIGGTRTRTFTNGRLSTFTTALPGLSLNTTLTYDTTGRIKTDTTNGTTTTYNYDAASQLTAATPSTGTPSSWTYDQLGRRATETRGTTTTSYHYDTASQLCWTTTNTPPANPTCAAPPSGATTYTYDTAGRLLNQTNNATNQITYTYDTAGRLATTQRINGATTTTQTRTYAPNDHLRTLTTGSATTTFDWDHTTTVAQLLNIATTTGTTNLTAGPSGWINARTALTNHAIGQRYDSSVAPTTNTTTLARATTYNPFGDPTGTDTFDPRLGYRGELTIDNQLHLRARTYTPDTATFTTTDPIEGAPGTTVTANPYHYTNNNPLHLTDPLGLFPGDNALQHDFSNLNFNVSSASTVAGTLTAGAVYTLWKAEQIVAQALAKQKAAELIVRTGTTGAVFASFVFVGEVGIVDGFINPVHQYLETQRLWEQIDQRYTPKRQQAINENIVGGFSHLPPATGGFVFDNDTAPYIPPQQATSEPDNNTAPDVQAQPAAGGQGRGNAGPGQPPGGPCNATNTASPVGEILRQDGIKIVIYSNDHAPPHAHVIGGGTETRIGQNGKPLAGDPELTKKQQKVVDDNINTIRDAIGEYMRWFRENC
jgi:RHS repeat-associated protein